MSNRQKKLQDKLQTHSFELSNSLEKITSQCISRIPRALRELEHIKKDTTVVKEKIDHFNARLSTMEHNNDESISILCELDRVKKSLEECNNAQIQAEKFKNLLIYLESLWQSQNLDSLESQNIPEIAKKLKEMDTSLDVLENLPEFRNSRQDLITYRQKLEERVAPKLISALEDHNTDLAIQLVSIFKQIDRVDRAYEYYYDCRLVYVDKLWNSFNLESQKRENYRFVDWLPGFYQELLLLLNTEIGWTSKVFGDDHSTVIATFVVKIQESLQKDFERRLENKEGVQSFLQRIIDSREITLDFTKNLEGLLHTTGKISKRVVMVRVVSPYKSLQRRYPELERSCLAQQLSNALPEGKDYMDSIQSVADSVSKVVLICEQAIDRCFKISDGSESEGLVSVLTSTFNRYLEHLFGLLKHLRVVSHLDSNEDAEKHGLDQSDRDYDLHDWKETYFQGALQLLEVVNKLTIRINGFDRSIRNRLIQQKQILFGTLPATSNDFSQIPSLHLSDEPEKARKLFRYLQSLEENVGTKVLSSCVDSCRSLHVSTQTLVFDSMFYYIKEKLEFVPRLEEWSQEKDSGTFSFSLSPQSYVKLVVEHLLLLPHLLEQAEQQELPFPDPLPVLQENNFEEEFFEDTQQTKLTDQKEGFAVSWISIVVRATMSMYLQKIFEIQKLSEFGATQLAVDIKHLFTFVSVFGDPDKVLQKVLEYLETPVPGFEKKMLNDPSGKKIGRMVGTIRGIQFTNHDL